jgi:ATP-dependent Clp protease protease subunit
VSPVVVEQTGRGERLADFYSRLLKDRIVFLGNPISDEVADLVTANCCFADRGSGEREKVLHQLAGGSVTADAIRETAASTAAILLLSGAKGRRYRLPHSHIMMHQLLGGALAETARYAAAATRRQAQVRNERPARYARGCSIDAPG